MPVTSGQAGYYHKDHETQREFERKDKSSALTNKVVNALVPKEGLPSDSGGNGTTDKTKIVQNIWALTTERDKVIIVKKVNQALNFVSAQKFAKTKTFGIEWRLTSEQLEETLRTIPEAKRTNIEASTIIPEWMLYDYEGIMSVVIDSIWTTQVDTYHEMTRSVHLVNDVDSPGLFKYYGTAADGIKGWFPLRGSGISYMKATIIAPATQIFIGKIPPRSIINRIDIDVELVFDTEIDLLVGEVGDTDKLWRLPHGWKSSQIYSIIQNAEYAVETDLYLSASAASTNGKATVYIHFD